MSEERALNRTDDIKNDLKKEFDERILLENAYRHFPEYELKIDPDAAVEGDAIYIGLSPVRCPVCNAHLARVGICLNACHLSGAERKSFHDSLRPIVKGCRCLR